MKILALCGVLAALVLSACATKPATLQTICQGVVLANQDFQTFVTLNPGKVDANGLATEAAILGTVGLSTNPAIPAATGSLCAPPYTVNTAQAVATASNAALQIALLLATWQK